MSAEVQESGKKKKGSKQKKMAVRVDFTPMVDMNMLLITFFMLCTSLSKPQTMEISMPSNDKNITEEQQSKVKASQAITLLLGSDNKLYYYEGEPNYKDYTSLKETSYKPDGLRAILLKKNAAAVRKVNELKQQKLELKISEDEFTKQLSEIKGGKDTPTVIIKATDDASYMKLMYMKGLCYEEQGNKNAARYCAMRMYAIQECMRNPRKKRPRFLDLQGYACSDAMNAFIERYTAFLEETYRGINRRLLMIVGILFLAVFLVLTLFLKIYFIIAALESIMLGMLTYLLQKRRMPDIFQKNQLNAIEKYVEQEVLEFDRPIRFS